MNVKAHLTAAGGVCGAEGSVWIHIDASAEKMDFIKKTWKQSFARNLFIACNFIYTSMNRFFQMFYPELAFFS